ncbi:ABC transporter permease [Umezawaea endophytica]|uniref:ABC-2 family transporter protein n=1 Tax=Umezawaea endophytica TaxID=1654476 RepID=A0A9X3AL48_9PSEU|nr:ABC-2 family transporter protein [Umezawaea endophytica]MCS7483885.1 ABC-2 family transporter protein [Umezawaea endophytica]
MRAWGSSQFRLAAAGFRRYSTYRQAMIAGTATNVVFGLLRMAVLLAALDAAPGGRIAGYDVAATVTYVWLGQGLLAFVVLWGDAALANRIRSGDVVVDLYRPWDLQQALLAEDLGRAAYCAVTRLVPPVVVGALLFPFRWPTPERWPVFLVSAVLAVLVSFGMRFLVNASTFWLLDNRGVMALYGVATGILCGLTVPLDFFPEWARFALWFTPMPAIMQSPIDVFIGHGSLWLTVGHQVFWAVALFLAGRLALARAVRKVVVQGG